MLAHALALPPLRNGLALPRLGRHIPSTYVVRDEPLAAAHLAKTMLAAGMLQETDWQGELVASIQAGVELWLYGLIGTGFKKLPLQFTYTTSVDNLYVEPSGWHEHHKLAPQPVGALALIADGFEWVTVGERVKELEAIRAGLGYSCLRILDAALTSTVGACTPRWAYGEIVDNMGYESQEEYRDEIEESEHMTAEEKASELAGLVTEENFLKDIPQEACTWRDSPIRQMIRAPQVDPDKLLPELAQTTVMALHLAKLLQGSLHDEKRHICEAGYFGNIDNYSTVRPVAIQWCKVDMVGRITDDFHQQMAETGEESHLLLVQGFALGEPPQNTGSFQSAMAKMIEVLEILLTADALLWHLNGDDRQQVKQQVKQQVRVRV